jgi:nitrite reductase/ring-hydroxylating ferredoxin subunit
MEGFTRVGPTSDFPPRRPKSLLVNGVDVVLVKLKDTVHAFENNCPHQHSSVLHQGTMEARLLTCPMHGWTFDVMTGKATNGNGRLRMFEAVVEGDFVWVRAEPEEPKFSLFDTQ